MTTETIYIANIKCSGCAQTITQKLTQLAGVNLVTVSVKDELVTIQHEGVLQRTDFTNRLQSLGYPEANTDNGLLTQAKSYASCMIGKLNNR
ncbi:MAG: heavy-metal-associated domain-containing protein [Bacteroidia bacterium]|jgi:copper chaperone CopZ|nr:heavy-metal-associated domain-containing protein [Bacteroidia bacterium]